MFFSLIVFFFLSIFLLYKYVHSYKNMYIYPHINLQNTNIYKVTLQIQSVFDFTPHFHYLTPWCGVFLESW